MSLNVTEQKEMAECAYAMIEESGRKITLKNNRNDTPDPSKPWEVSTNPISVTDVPACFVAPSDIEQLGITNFAEDLLKKIEQVAMVAPSDKITDDLSDFDMLLDTDGEEYRVFEVRKLKPGTVTLLYYIFVGR